ncbi:MAG TPA: amidohydrolase family protein [Acidimicrobiales bacterium]
MIVDTQVHLWRGDSPEHPWPKDRPNERVQRAEPCHAEEILGLMDDAGVDRAIIVPPIWAGDNNKTAIEWSEQYPNRLAIMGRFDLWDSDRERLEHWLDQPGMLGIRMSYPREHGPEWLQDVNAFAWFWSAAQRLGIPLMLLAQGAKPVQAIAERYPDLRLIVDHLGLHIIGAANPDQDPFEDFDDLLALGQYPNVYAKMSCLPTYSHTPYPHPDLTANLERVVEEFGPKRLMWGSDATRLRNATYAQCLEHISTLPFLDEDARTWILGRTAETVLGWWT